MTQTSAPKLEGNSIEDCYNALDAVVQEVAMADEAILSIICKRLCEENAVLGSLVIEDVCLVLSRYNRMPSLELLDATLNLLWHRAIYAISHIKVNEACSLRIFDAEKPI